MLAVRPRLLILDEPTSNLDPRSVREVVSTVDGLRKREEMTIVVVEHRPGQFIDLASRVMVMERGRLVTDRTRGSSGFSDLVPEPPKAVMADISANDGEAVSVTGLRFSIGTANIIDDVGFVVPQGSVTALMGENGAGKTTLLRLLTGLLRPEAGTMRILEHEIGPGAKTEPWVIGRDVGLVFQNPNHQIFEKTVEKEILFASDNYGVRMDEALDAVGSFETMEGVKRFVHPHCLSFGQKRRVNIASASSHGPRLVLMDEPFAGQDAANASRIRDVICGLRASGRTVIVVTHDIDFARTTSTHIVFMKRGRITRTGATCDVNEEEWDLLYAEGSP